MFSELLDSLCEYCFVLGCPDPVSFAASQFIVLITFIFLKSILKELRESKKLGYLCFLSACFFPFIEFWSDCIIRQYVGC